MFDLIAAKGLGDAIYMRALALHLRKRGEPVTVFTGWPDAFLGADVNVKPLSARTGAEDIRHCKYCLHCRMPEVPAYGMFEMACRQAGIFDPVELRADWSVTDQSLVKMVKQRAAGRPVLVYQPLKAVSGVEQKIAQPRESAYLRWLEKSDHFRVKIGQGDGLCELDLTGRTTVAQAFDVASAADLIFGEPCYLITLAQAMDKPYACMFARAAQDAVQSRVRNLTPERFLAKPGAVLYDDC